MSAPIDIGTRVRLAAGWAVVTGVAHSAGNRRPTGGYMVRWEDKRYEFRIDRVDILEVASDTGYHEGPNGGLPDGDCVCDKCNPGGDK